MYHIYGLNFFQGILSIECLLDYPIENMSEAKRKYKKVIDYQLKDWELAYLIQQKVFG